jgi:hypothetical protein
MCAPCSPVTRPCRLVTGTCRQPSGSAPTDLGSALQPVARKTGPTDKPELNGARLSTRRRLRRSVQRPAPIRAHPSAGAVADPTCRGLPGAVRRTETKRDPTGRFSRQHMVFPQHNARTHARCAARALANVRYKRHPGKPRHHRVRAHGPDAILAHPGVRRTGSGNRSPLSLTMTPPGR